MSIKDMVPEKVINNLGILGKRLDVASPKLLLAAGIGGFVATTVLASKATLKADTILDAAQEKLEDMQNLVATNDAYSDEDYLRDRIYFYAMIAGEIARVYTPAVVVGSFSIFCFVKSNHILSERNVALTAAYAGLHKSFEAYRKRVRALVGDEKERDIYFDAETVTREVKHDDGKTLAITEKKVGQNAFSQYARFFDETSTNWTRTPEYNFVFLRAQQNWANDMLRTRGYVFLNEVYDMLGLERSYQGQVTGWMIDGDGDNFIDFGFMDGERERARAFVNGLEGAVLLDFNVDGVIIDKIPNFRKKP